MRAKSLGIKKPRTLDRNPKPKGITDTEFHKLLADYEKACEAYTAAVHALAAAEGSLEFDQIWNSLNALHMKSEDIRKRLEAARKGGRRECREQLMKPEQPHWLGELVARGAIIFKEEPDRPLQIQAQGSTPTR